jgi:bleomycin hydrolase
MKNLFITLILLLLTVNFIKAQDNKDKAYFKEYAPGYFQKYILSGIQDFEEPKVAPKVDKALKMYVVGLKLPKNIKDYSPQWHNKPISQGNTNTCWSYSTTSFFETEVYRLTKKQVKLSEMYVVYNEYIEKTKRFVQMRGNSAFSEGSEGNAVTRTYKKYGIVPYEAYNGLKPGQVEFRIFDNVFKNNDEFKKDISDNLQRNIDNNYATIVFLEYEKGNRHWGHYIVAYKYNDKIVYFSFINIIFTDSLRPSNI